MKHNRRTFLAALSAAPFLTPQGVLGANSRPAFGIVGTGSRGSYLHSAFQKLGAQCVAVCDVYEPYRERAKKNSPADAKAWVDYHDLLAQNGVDFVVSGTPDHHHWPVLRAALEAGKDIYTEKPLSLNLEQSAQMVEAVRQSDRIVQVGMQRRSMPYIWKAKEFIDGGGLGNVWLAKAMWNWNFDVPLDNSPLEGKLDWKRFLGPAPERPLEPKRFRWWRAFWDYSGGNMTDQGTHLMDVVQWMTNSGPPRSAVCQGMIAAAKAGEVPDVFSAAFEYPNMLATWTLNYTSSYDFDWSIQFIGDKAAMVMDRNGVRVYKDAGASRTPWSKGGEPDMIMEEPGKEGAEPHFQNFLDCLVSRKQPNCTVEIAAAAVTGPHMANLSYRQSKKISR